MRTVGICGHFAGQEETASGQVIKTRIVANELVKKFGASEVIKVDSHGGARAFFRMIWQSFSMFRKCKNIIIMPAYKGLRVFVPLFTLYNVIFHRCLHYIVIGGWLDSFLERHRWLINMLKGYSGIYVETAMMKENLNRMGFSNIIIMPNFKELPVVKTVLEEFNEPYKLCTFSRVMKEKGIETAIEAVININNMYGKIVFTIDIFGQIDSNYSERFSELQEAFPEYIKYKGLVPYDQSVDTLQSYFALIFPTFYSGEGFAGTLIDAMSAGVPVVASNWKYNSEIVVPGRTGMLLSDCNTQKLMDELVNMLEHPNIWISMRATCIEESRKYSPGLATQCLLKRLQG